MSFVDRGRKAHYQGANRYRRLKVGKEYGQQDPPSLLLRASDICAKTIASLIIFFILSLLSSSAAWPICGKRPPIFPRASQRAWMIILAFRLIVKVLSLAQGGSAWQKSRVRLVCFARAVVCGDAHAHHSRCIHHH